jgi:hypothetical protein
MGLTNQLEYSAAAQPGGALDAVKRGGADAASLLAAQVTLIVSSVNLWIFGSE